MKTYSSKDLIRMVQEAGWVLERVSGSHHQFKHQSKPGLVTIPHPRKNLPVKTVKNILKQAGLG
ncbi:MAG: type II toxin-antitoxin system HicA family toxin [Pelotomaculum sp.]|nr:type II toxin-antitoxin system HicA family toxin [Pelotomaculum sp.]